MTYRLHISTFILRLSVNLLLLCGVTTTQAQVTKMFRMEKDSIPFFRGFALSFDLVGPAMLMLSDHGEYEGALRINLHDQWFPIFELGVGHANHKTDEVTEISYKTTAPYFRIGMDWNVLKKKHGPNRMYAGFRYAFTYYNVDLDRQTFPDPVWQWDTSFGVKGESCYQHWLEALVGIDAKVYGPLHLGWSVRYRRRLFHDDGLPEKTWYVPGYGTQESTRLGYTFNVTIDI